MSTKLKNSHGIAKGKLIIQTNEWKNKKQVKG